MWWDMGNSPNQQCNMTRVRIDHCRLELEGGRGTNRGVKAVMAQYLSRRLNEAGGGRKSMSRFDCLEILLHMASLHPVGRGVPTAYRAVNANHSH